MSPRVTLDSLLLKKHEIETLDYETLRYVAGRWLQGRHITLPLDKAEPLLIRADEVKRMVHEATRELESLFRSPYGDVWIYSIRSPRREYGTGKISDRFLHCQ